MSANPADGEDYVLGTHDEELRRLGLQHSVWRPRMLACWQNSGITVGSKVLDVGAGPGYATFDLADIVGSGGRVVAVEKSIRFVETIETQRMRRGVEHVEAQHIDLMRQAIPAQGFDAAWTRWVASFVAEPDKLVEAIGLALRPGGQAIFHEYGDYASWKFSPASPVLEEFVQRVMTSWRDAGGEPDIARSLPTLLAGHGFRVCHVEPMVFCVSPKHYVWKWPASFINVNLKRLIELNAADEKWAATVRRALADAESNEESLMVTPLVFEIVARKLTEHERAG